MLFCFQKVDGRNAYPLCIAVSEPIRTIFDFQIKKLLLKPLDKAGIFFLEGAGDFPDFGSVLKLKNIYPYSDDSEGPKLIKINLLCFEIMMFFKTM